MQVHCLSQWVFMILPTLCAVLPWVSSRSVWPSVVRRFDTSSSFFPKPESLQPVESPSEDRISSVQKRSGSDPWGICPRSLTRIDCFYRYVGIYAEMLADMDDSGARNSRPLGKRSAEKDLDSELGGDLPVWLKLK